MRKTIPALAVIGSLWNEAITVNMAARIMAVLMVFGNHVNFAHNEKLKLEREYIEEHYGLRPDDTPDDEFLWLLKNYVAALENYGRAHRGLHNVPPTSWPMAPWAMALVFYRYGIKPLSL